MIIKARTGLKAHEKMKLSLSGCPNGCSRPHIYGMGIIGAVRPLVDSSQCTGCRVCADVCREEAINITDDKAVISPDKCLLCGECIPACPEDAITSHEQGYRIVVGGRLGRHPRLTRELEGLYSLEQTKLILSRLMHMHQAAFEQGTRLSYILGIPPDLVTCPGLDR
jgi:anaerobic sulfite reductase subunit C